MISSAFLAEYAAHGHSLNTSLALISEQARIVGYAAATVGIVIEGDAVLFTAGFLAHQGVFHPALLLCWLIAGGSIGDIAWYKLGAYLNTRSNRVVTWLKRATDPLGPYLEHRRARNLVISKFIYGVNHAILCKAGAMQIPLRTFAAENLRANSIWIVLVGGLGYLSSMGAVHVLRTVHHIELGLLATLVIFLLCTRILSPVIKRKI